ncbi:glutaredoxin family protein [Streptomyces sp. SID8352]|uniref:glutaredoxin family protein n=1 Tax=Streptomyces sp. SID8352 TaxID=2690338 RepID=UPI001367B0C6|nr:glutaredoxin family protein [Streptomyces sp. SID8352]MYU20841.1 glutaredoxin family protein [Streptomyces sp. SID8352]
MAAMSPLFGRKTPRSPRPSGAPQAGSPPPPSARPEDHLVTLVRKPGCHLCDDAQLVVEKVCGELGVPWEQKDITEDARLHDQYWEQIPVVLVDGRQHTFWRVNEERLRRALTDRCA